MCFGLLPLDCSLFISGTELAWTMAVVVKANKPERIVLQIVDFLVMLG
jgi:hypothetical protein